MPRELIATVDAAARHAPSNGTQGTHLEYVAHGGVRGPEVGRTAQPQPDQGPPAAKGDARHAPGGDRALQAPRLRDRGPEGRPVDVERRAQVLEGRGRLGGSLILTGVHLSEREHVLIQGPGASTSEIRPRERTSSGS